MRQSQLCVLLATIADLQSADRGSVVPGQVENYHFIHRPVSQSIICQFWFNRPIYSAITNVNLLGKGARGTNIECVCLMAILRDYAV